VRDDHVMDRLLLAEVEQTLTANRRRSGALRFPLAAIAVANAGLAVWCLAAGRHRLLIVYLPTLGVLGLAGRAHARRVAERSGVRVSLLRWVLTAVGLALASAAVSRLGVASEHAVLEEVGPTFVWVAGYHLLGWWGRNRLLIGGSLALAAIDCGLAMITSGDVRVAVMLAASAVVLALVAYLTSPSG
jgi:hypothetical protein